MTSCRSTCCTLATAPGHPRSVPPPRWVVLSITRNSGLGCYGEMTDAIKDILGYVGGNYAKLTSFWELQAISCAFAESAFSHTIHTTPAVLTLSRLIPVALWTWAQVARCRSRHPIWRTWAEMGHLWWWGRRQTPRFFVRFSGWRNSASAPSPILGRLGCPFQRAGWWLRSQFVDHSLIGGFLK